MTDAPFMQLYIADYLGDTLHLTTEQHGAYLLLLMAMWRQGGRLPNDPKILAQITRTRHGRWQKIAGQIMPFFVEDGLWITHKRLAREYEKAVSVSQSRKSNGKRGGDAKSLRYKMMALANGVDTLWHSQIPYRKEALEEEKQEPLQASAALLASKLVQGKSH